MSNVIDSWTVNYRPEGRGRFMGILSVSDRDVQFSSGDLEEDIVLPRPDIAKTEAAKRGLLKQVVVTMSDGRSYVFEYGMLSVKKIVDTINTAGTGS